MLLLMFNGNILLKQCRHIILRISPARIAFLRFILEGYDGLAVVSTINAEEGLVRVWFPPSSGRDVIDLLNELAFGLNNKQSLDAHEL